MALPKRDDSLIAKIRALPADKVAEVEDFVDFLSERTAGRDLVHAASEIAEPSFREVWDDPENDVYDRL